MCGYKVHAGSVQHIKEGSTAASMMEHIVHTLKRHTGTDRRNKTLSEWQQSVNEVELSGTTHRPSSAEYFFFFLSSFLSGTSCFVHAPLRPAASFASSVNSRAQLCGLCVYIQCIKKGCMCKKKKKWALHVLCILIYRRHIMLIFIGLHALMLEKNTVHFSHAVFPLTL